MKLMAIMFSLLTLSACSSFQAERVDAKKSDEKAMKITDEWVSADTEQVIKEVVEQMIKHKGFRQYTGQLGRSPRLFTGDIQNLTSDPYFPINDVNDEFLNELSVSGDFTLVDAQARESILKEVTYQNDGAVDPETARKIGKQTGADLMIFGNVYMRPQTRDGKTIKEYAVNLRMTDIERAVEVLRVRTKLFKYSERKSVGL
jgi:penicillin-binding protein activator